MIPSIFAAIEDQGRLYGPTKHHSRRRDTSMHAIQHSRLAEVETLDGRKPTLTLADTQCSETAKLDWWEAEISQNITGNIRKLKELDVALHRRRVVHRKKTMASQFINPTETARSTRRNTRLPLWLKEAAAAAFASRGPSKPEPSAVARMRRRSARLSPRSLAAPTPAITGTLEEAEDALKEIRARYEAEMARISTIPAVVTTLKDDTRKRR
jgi:hypothetical protein